MPEFGAVRPDDPVIADVSHRNRSVSVPDLLPGNGAASAVLVLVVVLAGWCGCKKKPTPFENRSSEDLVSIVNEIQLERKRDIYRLPYPLDPEGRNLYESALERIDDWNRLHPNKFMDIVWFARGLCHEKLAQIQDAYTCYSAVRSKDPELQAAAEKRARVMADLLDVFETEDGTRLETDSEPGSEETVRKAIDQYRGTPWESLVRVLAENRAVKECLDLRSRRGSGSETAYREAIENLIVRFKDSKRIYQHWLMLGRYWEDVMREWTARAEFGSNPEAWKLAEKALSKAEEIYLKVSQADGYPEKLEARARLQTLEEIAGKIETHLQQP